MQVMEPWRLTTAGKAGCLLYLYFMFYHIQRRGTSALRESYNTETYQACTRIRFQVIKILPPYFGSRHVAPRHSGQ